MVIPVVVKVENSVEFAVNRDSKVLRVLHPLAQRLSGVLLHLDVVKFPATKYRYKINLFIVLAGRNLYSTPPYI